MRSLLISLLVAPLALAWPASAQDQTKLVRDIVNGHIVPSYQNLAVSSQSLSKALQSSCAQPGGLAVPATQMAFKDVLADWMAVQHIRFGPAMLDDRFYRFQFWPDKHGQAAKQIRRRLAGPLKNIPDAGQISKTSVALQGLPALERILFASRPMEPEQRKKACKLATAIGFNLEDMARQTYNDWKSYTQEDPKDVLDAVTRGLIEQLQIMTSLKLVRPLGKSLEAARPRRSESWRSRMSLKNIKSNLEGLRDLLGGNETNPGLASVLPNEGETLGIRAAIIAQLAYGIERLEASRIPLHDAVSAPESRKEVRSLVAQIDGIRELVLEQLVPALGLNMGFNAQDGD